MLINVSFFPFATLHPCDKMRLHNKQLVGSTMQIVKLSLATFLLIISLSTTSCRRTSDQVWDDSRTATRHVSRGVRSLGGKHGDSRAVQCRDQFMPYCDSEQPMYANYAPTIEEEFIPLADLNNEDEMAMADYVAKQPRETPGDPGSSIPGISAFQDPSNNATWAGIFRNVGFEYNSNLIKGDENFNTIHAVATYMKNNPNVYAFVEGHCDERGPEAYNLALGSRRSNAVRNQLIQEGVNPDNIFTISYGKERPLFLDHNDLAWAQNRRAEFKIYQR